MKKYNILIVEDEEINFLFLEALLQNIILIDCTILHAKNGHEAVNYCENDATIDYVLMDIKMPIMNGLEATRKIKLINPKLPVVAQTAYSTQEDIDRALSAGCDEVITKPINSNTLKNVLHKYLPLE